MDVLGATSALSATAAALDNAPFHVDLPNNRQLLITPHASADDTALDGVMALMAKDLSEPYSIFTYRYFMMGWPEYCLLVRGARAGGEQMRFFARSSKLFFGIDCESVLSLF